MKDLSNSLDLHLLHQVMEGEGTFNVNDDVINHPPTLVPENREIIVTETGMSVFNGSTLNEHQPFVLIQQVLGDFCELPTILTTFIPLHCLLRFMYPFWRPPLKFSSPQCP